MVRKQENNFPHYDGRNLPRCTMKARFMKCSFLPIVDLDTELEMKIYRLNIYVSNVLIIDIYYLEL